MALKSNGMVAARGADAYHESDRPPLTNFIAVAAGDYHSLGLKEDGTVAIWGQYWDGSNSFYSNSLPATNMNFVAVAAGAEHDIGLLANGTVAVWGWSNAPANVPPTNTLTNISAVACGWYHNLALSNNGTVFAWGSSSYAGVTPAPAGLTGVTAIAACANHSLALKGDGTVVAWGYNEGLTNNGPTNVPAALSGVVAIATGYQHSLALRSNGMVVAWGYNQGLGINGPTNVPPAALSNVMAIAAGWTHSVALLTNGTVVSWGTNAYGATNVPAQLANVVGRSIAAGGNHTLETIFSSNISYTVNVTNDLLLIYNINSTDSSNVCAYYLANRPMVSNANVLGINCTTSETLDPTNWPGFASQITTWLTNNPTKRPLYVILFPGIPSRVNSDDANPWPLDGTPIANGYSGSGPTLHTPSVQYRLVTNWGAAWQPIVTSINMDGNGQANDCKAYVNKLAYFGSNYSSGQLFISASAGGYGNSNWYAQGSTLFPNGVLSPIPGGNVISNFLISTNNTVGNYTNVGGFFFLGVNGGNVTNTYPTNGNIIFSNSSSWYIIDTTESFNGERTGVGQALPTNGFEGTFTGWFS